MYGSVVAVIDGSDETTGIIESASRLAGTLDAELHVLYVMNVRLARSARWMETCEREGSALLDEIGQYAAERGLSVTTSMETGLPAETVLDYIEDTGVDLVVVGGKKPTRSRFFPGDSVQKIVRDAPVSVLTVRHHER